MKNVGREQDLSIKLINDIPKTRACEKPQVKRPLTYINTQCWSELIYIDYVLEQNSLHALLNYHTELFTRLQFTWLMRNVIIIIRGLKPLCSGKLTTLFMSTFAYTFPYFHFLICLLVTWIKQGRRYRLKEFIGLMQQVKDWDRPKAGGRDGIKEALGHRALSISYS